MYVPLFVHSSYSLLRSTIKIKDLVEYAADSGISAIALTDYHNLFGAMEFSMSCVKQGIRPIIGSRVRLEGNREVLLYCKNRIGYENLSYLLSNSYTKAHDRHPAIRWETLFKKSDGLIAVALPSILSSHNLDDLRVCAEHLNSTMEWYVGLEPHRYFYKESAYMSQIFNTPVVALSETYFLHKEQQEAHDVLLCIRNKNYITQFDRQKSDQKYCMMNYEQMLAAFDGLDFAVQNTNRLADRCSFYLEPSKPKLPRFRTKPGDIGTEEVELARVARIGLSNMQVPHKDIPEYEARLEYELQVINKMGFAGYFLIVSDFVKFARDHGIPVSIRGSGAGSLVARCVDITEIDPIQFELFFERFLNPGRVSMPDFDIDFSPKGREKTIEYVVQKYGQQCVSGIITFGSLSSRAVLKDVGRVLQVPYGKLDNLCKHIQVLFGRPFSLQETYDHDPEFAKEVDGDEALAKTFQIAQQLEGLFRHASAHAAGIIITDGPIYRTAPLYKDENAELPLVQFSMKYAELAGLIKFDFLGVTALDVIADSIAEIKAAGHTINLYAVPLHDRATFEFLRTGHTRGVFQFETSGMTKLIRDLEADCIEDLIATVSLYRPGPMDNIPLFIKCKKGVEKVQYIYPALENILSNTYGIIVYQEQILRIVQEIAGYSLSEADLLRRAIGKKIPEEMAKHKQDFIERAHKLQGGDVGKAEELFKLIETFANYGFNKAHAAAYAIVGYRGAYLKTHYPLYFICVSMTAEQNNTDKLVELVMEARNMGIEVHKPCVNTSMAKFTISNGAILYSLAAIKNIGEHLAHKLIAARPFTSLREMVEKVHLNKREVESLVKSGALDCFGMNRGTLSQVATILLNQRSASLFDPELFVDESYDWSKIDMLKSQKEILGFYLDDHPLSEYPVSYMGSTSISQIDLSNDLTSASGAAMLESYSQKLGKRGGKYYACTFSDLNGSWHGMVVDEKLLDSIPSMKGSPLWCIVQVRGGRIVVKEILPIEAKIDRIQDIRVKVRNEDEIYKLKEALEKFKSDDGTSVYLHTDQVMFVGCISKVLEFVKQLRLHDLQMRLG